MRYSALKKRFLYLLTAGCLSITGLFMGVLTGCGNSKLEQAYSFSQREKNLTASEAARAPLFAEDLCVLDGSIQDNDTAITAEAGGLFNITDASVVYSKHATERLHPASITKVMTALIAIEDGNLDDVVTVTDAAVVTEAGASLCGIKPGDQITLRDLLYGLMMPSGKDAANAIAVHM